MLQQRFSSRECDVVAGKAENDLGDFSRLEIDLDIRLQWLAKVYLRFPPVAAGSPFEVPRVFGVVPNAVQIAAAEPDENAWCSRTHTFSLEAVKDLGAVIESSENQCVSHWGEN